MPGHELLQDFQGAEAVFPAAAFEDAVRQVRARRWLGLLEQSASAVPCSPAERDRFRAARNSAPGYLTEAPGRLTLIYANVNNLSA
jgi:hypothetical protein